VSAADTYVAKELWEAQQILTIGDIEVKKMMVRG
jgi:hypothetical protein